MSISMSTSLWHGASEVECDENGGRRRDRRRDDDDDDDDVREGKAMLAIAPMPTASGRAAGTIGATMPSSE
jgi:hypothetical protein